MSNENAAWRETVEAAQELTVIKQLFSTGAPQLCAAVAGLVVQELAPRKFDKFTAVKDSLRIVYAVDGPLVVYDDTAEIITLPKGRAFLVSLFEEGRLGFENPSSAGAPCRFIEIELELWPSALMTCAMGHFGEQEEAGEFRSLVSLKRRRQVTPLHNEVNIFSASLRDGDIVRHKVNGPELPGWGVEARAVWIFVAKGCVECNGKLLSQFSDDCFTTVATDPESRLYFNGPIELVSRSDDAEVLLIDSSLPPSPTGRNCVREGATG